MNRIRRRHTRWLIATPIVALAAIVGGVIALEAAHPQLDDLDMTVDNIPMVAAEGAETCIRRSATVLDDTNASDIRERFRTTAARGQRVTSSQVYACPVAFDGLDIIYVGEVVGELIVRRGGVWAHVNDDMYALEVGPVVGHREHSGFNSGLAVWLPDGLHESISDVGRPAQRGDVIVVTGTLFRADPDDGGSITLRAGAMEVAAAAVTIDPPLHLLQALVAGLLGVAVVVALVWLRIQRNR